MRVATTRRQGRIGAAAAAALLALVVGVVLTGSGPAGGATDRMAGDEAHRDMGSGTSAHLGASAATTYEPGSVNDSFSTVGTFRTSDGWYASPIHATMLLGGKVFFIGIARPTAVPTTAAPKRAVAWTYTPPAAGTNPPASTVIQEIKEPVQIVRTTDANGLIVEDDFYCTSTVLDATGRVITVGGTRNYANPDGSIAHTLGLDYQTVLDEKGWRQLPGSMVGKGIFGTASRWYPTATRLPNKKILVTGGVEVITNQDVGYSNRTVESLDPATNARALVSGRDDTPEAMQARDYAHVFVLPYDTGAADLLVFGEAGIPIFGKSTGSPAWSTPSPARPGNGGGTVNWGTSSVMLPIRAGNGEWGYTNGSVLMASGDMDTPFEHQAAVFNANGTWKPTIELTANRHHPSTVLLPDSRVLVLNGHDMGGDVRVQQAQYVDPAKNLSVVWGKAASNVVRGYHSTATLLPDGRVLVAGGRDVNTKTSLEKPTFQIYTPDYVAKTRPTILSAPTAVPYDGLFNIGAEGPAPKEVQLIGLSSMTHSFDTGQRAVQLPVGQVYTNAEGRSLAVVGGPKNSHVAPPGYYWLFIVDANRVPSKGQLVKVG